jgi:hypothetical protein
VAWLTRHPKGDVSTRCPQLGGNACSHVTLKKPKGVVEPPPLGVVSATPLAHWGWLSYPHLAVGVAYHPAFGSLGVANHPPNRQGGGYITCINFFIGAGMTFC